MTEDLGIHLIEGCDDCPLLIERNWRHNLTHKYEYECGHPFKNKKIPIIKFNNAEEGEKYLNVLPDECPLREEPLHKMETFRLKIGDKLTEIK